MHVYEVLPGTYIMIISEHNPPGLFIITLAAFPCYALHLNIEGLLLLVGQDAEVSR